MGRYRDNLKGQRFGRLTAVEPTEERKNGYTVWRCRCDCGNEILAPSRYLKHGWAGDCGCCSRKEDGYIRKKETVLKEQETKAGPNYGSSESEETAGTGNKINQSGDGKTGSAGRIRIKDWVGRSFGDLRVVAYDGKRGGKHYWRCRCICGGEAVVNQSNLQDGHTRSCGCRVDPAATRHFVEGTCIESIRSRKVSVRNNSGIRGVYQNKRTGRWAAQITFQGKTRYLGSYDSLEEAAEARGKAEKVFEDFLDKFDTGALKAGSRENGDDLWTVPVEYFPVRSGHGKEA